MSLQQQQPQADLQQQRIDLQQEQQQQQRSDLQQLLGRESTASAAGDETSSPSATLQQRLAAAVAGAPTDMLSNALNPRQASRLGESLALQERLLAAAAAGGTPGAPSDSLLGQAAQSPQVTAVHERLGGDLASSSTSTPSVLQQRLGSGGGGSAVGDLPNLSLQHRLGGAPGPADISASMQQRLGGAGAADLSSVALQQRLFGPGGDLQDNAASSSLLQQLLSGGVAPAAPGDATALQHLAGAVAGGGPVGAPSQDLSSLLAQLGQRRSSPSSQLDLK